MPTIVGSMPANSRNTSAYAVHLKHVLRNKQASKVKFIMVIRALGAHCQKETQLGTCSRGRWLKLPTRTRRLRAAQIRFLPKVGRLLVRPKRVRRAFSEVPAVCDREPAHVGEPAFRAISVTLVSG